MLGLLAGLGAAPLAAQSWELPASDPVSIARSGTGVAFGNSLEAASLNPALLATLRDGLSAYVAYGMEMQAAKATLQNNGNVLYSSDRNRSIPALGAAWRIGPATVLGFKIDEPFMRHAQMPLAYTGRFLGQAFDLKTRRMELQMGWAATPNWAFGASLGATQIQYGWDNQVRSVVSTPGTGPLGLMETDLHQRGSKLAPSYSLGFRWAPNSRWTLGGTYVGSMKTALPLTASYGSLPPSYYTLTGNAPAPTGTSGAGVQQMATTVLNPGNGDITLPGKLTLGVRQRVNQVFTWEADVRYVLGAQTTLPGHPSATPAGAATINSPGQVNVFRNGFGITLMGELTLSKDWTLRIGAALDPPLRADADVEPVVGGAKSSGLSGGFGYKAFGGELSLGYQYRQSQNIDTPNLDGAWKNTGFATNPASVTRVEGMGHLWSVGFKRAF
jgi:long-subunit fatty acid transport protein